MDRPDQDYWSKARKKKREKRIQACQKRLALSASPGADALLDLWGVEPEIQPLGTATGSLLQQATDIGADFGFTGRGQTIAVIDSGIAYDHVALGGGYGPGYRVVGGWDFAEQDADPYDDGPSGFHGTHVAGILAGDGAGFRGIAPEADLVALRVFTDQGASNMDWIEDALQWVYDHRNDFANPITTVNLSIGALIPSQLTAQVQAQLEDQLQLLHNSGITVIAAAGNQFNASTPETLTYPAASSFVTAVSSVSASGTLSGFAQRGDEILAAPGEAVRSTVPDHVLGWDGVVNDFSTASGTSMAAPQVAAATVLVRQALTARGLPADSQSAIDLLRSTADHGRDATTGIDYYAINLRRAIDHVESLHPGTVDPQDPAGEADDPVDSIGRATDLGEVTSTAATLNGQQWYRVQAHRHGLLSVLGDDALGSASSPLRITDETGKVWWQGTVSRDTQIDLPASTGQVFMLRGEGASALPLRMVNLVSMDQGTLAVQGTQSSDDVQIDLSNAVRVEIGRAKYQWSTDTLQRVQVDLGGGADQLRITGSSGADRIVMGVGNGFVETSKLKVNFSSSETTEVTGGGGADRAYLYDSAGNDQLEARPNGAVMSGVGYRQSVSGVTRIYAFGNNGGEDTAVLYDSTGDDRLAIRHQFTSLTGSTFFVNATGFERVQAYASAGGRDSAQLYDSPGDDRMSATSVQAWISGPGYFAQARGFEQVDGFASAGGNDYATLYASAGQEFSARGDNFARMQSGDMIRSAQGFERLETLVQGSAAPAVQVATLSLEPTYDDTSRSVDLNHESTSRSGFDLDRLDQRVAHLLRASEKLSPRRPIELPALTLEKEREALGRLFADLDATSR